MAEKILYLIDGRIEAVDGVPEFKPENMEDSVDAWPFRVIGYQDEAGNWVLHRFGDNIITDQHPLVVPKGGEIGQLLKKQTDGADWATPTPEDASAEPYMGKPEEDGLYRVADVDGEQYWGTGSEDPPLTRQQFQKIAIIMELIQ